MRVKYPFKHAHRRYTVVRLPLSRPRLRSSHNLGLKTSVLSGGPTSTVYYDLHRMIDARFQRSQESSKVEGGIRGPYLRPSSRVPMSELGVRAA